MATLFDRVAAFVASHPGLTLDEIARGVRVRDGAVRDVLAGEAFSASLRDEDVPRSPQVYRLAPVAAAGLGRAARRSQCDLIAAVLEDGRWHTSGEIHRRCGYSRLNSRVAELRGRRGMLIECRHVDGRGRGIDAYEYLFTGFRAGFGPSETADARDSPVPSSAVSDGPDDQLDLGAAA